MISEEAKKMLIVSLEYVLEVGIDKALERLPDVTKADVKDFPYVREALEERDLLK